MRTTFLIATLFTLAFSTACKTKAPTPVSEANATAPVGEATSAEDEATSAEDEAPKVGAVELPERGMIFHLSRGAESPHHVIHPLVRANAMVGSGIGVLVYLDIEAAPLVFADAAPVKFNKYDSVSLIASIVEGGGRVAICAQCAKQFDKSKEDLLAGVVVATPEMLFQVGEKTLTFDY